MFCYLNAAFTVCLKGSSILKRQRRKVVLFFYFIVHLLFLRELVCVIHPRDQIQSFPCTQSS